MDGDDIGSTRSCTLTINQATEDITTKDSGYWEEHMATLKNANVAFNGLKDPANTYNAEELLDLILDNTNSSTVLFQPASPVTNDVLLSMTATLESHEEVADNMVPVAISGNFKCNGQPTKTVQT